MTNSARLRDSEVQNERSDNLTLDGKALGRVHAKARQRECIDGSYD